MHSELDPNGNLSLFNGFYRKDFNMASQWHIILFPHLLYPFNQVAVTGSIFMTVAIAWERYVAVHYPLDYNQVGEPKSMGKFPSTGGRRRDDLQKQLLASVHSSRIDD